MLFVRTWACELLGGEQDPTLESPCTLDRLAALDMPPLTAEEVAAEIEAARRERHPYRS